MGGPTCYDNHQRSPLIKEPKIHTFTPVFGISELNFLHVAWLTVFGIEEYEGYRDSYLYMIWAGFQDGRGFLLLEITF